MRRCSKRNFAGHLGCIQRHAKLPCLQDRLAPYQRRRARRPQQPAQRSFTNPFSPKPNICDTLTLSFALARTSPVFSPKSKEELTTAVDAYLKLSPKGDCSECPHGPIGEWDVSRVTDMSALFGSGKKFNGDISKWDVSRVTTMEGMFNGLKSFNGDISKWDVSRVLDMSAMFVDAQAFNGDISKWDVSSVTTMKAMFADAKGFNGDVSKWSVVLVGGHVCYVHGCGSFFRRHLQVGCITGHRHEGHV